MKEGNLCERCEGKVHPKKAIHKQTKYCERCAQVMKRVNTLDSWSPKKRRDYMRLYMHEKRAQARLRCSSIFLLLLGACGLLPGPFQLTFDDIETLFGHAEI